MKVTTTFVLRFEIFARFLLSHTKKRRIIRRKDTTAVEAATKITIRDLNLSPHFLTPFEELIASVGGRDAFVPKHWCSRGLPMKKPQSAGCLRLGMSPDRLLNETSRTVS